MADLPTINLQQFKDLFENRSKGLELNDGSLRDDDQKEYSSDEASTLAASAGRELGNLLADFRDQYKAGEIKKNTPEFRSRLDQLQSFQEDMMVPVFGTLFLLIDKITRLDIELETVNPQARTEKQELREATKALADFVENNLVLKFFEGFKKSSLGVKSGTYYKSIQAMKTMAQRTSGNLSSDQRIGINRNGEPRYNQACETVIDRLFDSLIT